MLFSFDYVTFLFHTGHSRKLHPHWTYILIGVNLSYTTTNTTTPIPTPTVDRK